jgi:hypothetical protein
MINCYLKEERFSGLLVDSMGGIGKAENRNKNVIQTSMFTLAIGFTRTTVGLEPAASSGRRHSSSS